MLSFFLAHDSAYRRNYAPDFAVWVQGCASQHLVCRTCGGKHFTQDCGEDFGPWDSALFTEELTEFWFCCEQYSRNYELTRTDSMVVPPVPDTPPLSAPAAPAAAPPPAAPLPVPERVLPRTTGLASTNRFAPLLSLDTDPVVDTSVPEQAFVDPVLLAPQPARQLRLSRMERRLPRSITLAAVNPATSLRIRVELQSTVTQRIVSDFALIDCGATGLGYVDTAFVIERGIPTSTL
ncbi:hypothetical protein MKEN_01007400 [Mycena kentingensis (nom. inval.)]|nr:hypothetical protein MKEN_01007400 [Mycena kentingensis (nom. inval.)]